MEPSSTPVSFYIFWKGPAVWIIDSVCNDVDVLGRQITAEHLKTVLAREFLCLMRLFKTTFAIGPKVCRDNFTSLTTRVSFIWVNMSLLADLLKLDLFLQVVVHERFIIWYSGGDNTCLHINMYTSAVTDIQISQLTCWWRQSRFSLCYDNQSMCCILQYSEAVTRTMQYRQSWIKRLPKLNLKFFPSVYIVWHAGTAIKKTRYSTAMSSRSLCASTNWQVCCEFAATQQHYLAVLQ
jgi:hypothetical protein